MEFHYLLITFAATGRKAILRAGQGPHSAALLASDGTFKDVTSIDEPFTVDCEINHFA